MGGSTFSGLSKIIVSISNRENHKKIINDFRVSCDLNRIRDYINEHFSHYSCYGNKYDINDLFFFVDIVDWDIIETYHVSDFFGHVSVNSTIMSKKNEILDMNMIEHIRDILFYRGYKLSLKINRLWIIFSFN